ERLEGALGREFHVHRSLPPRARPKSAEYRLGRRFAAWSRTNVGGSWAPLPRTGGAPVRSTVNFGAGQCRVSSDSGGRRNKTPRGDESRRRLRAGGQLLC